MLKVGVVGLGAMGSLCIGMALSSFLYRAYHEREINQPLQVEGKAVAS